MSTRNPSGWTTIRDTVRKAQDTLFRLYLGLKYQESRDYKEKALKAVAHVYDMSPPQTLGELCLELYADGVMRTKKWADRKGYELHHGNWPAAELRGLLYRRNTDPTPKVQPDGKTRIAGTP